MSHRPTRAIVDLAAIRHNLGLVREQVGADCRIAAVVKADGYGHGLIEAGRACLQAGAERLCVALVDQAVKLRRSFPHVPILVMGTIAALEAEAVVEHDLTQTVDDRDAVEALDAAASAAGKRVRLHLKIDTGMTRIGVLPHEAVAFMEQATRYSHVDFEGVYSHFAKSDEPDLGFARRQLHVFLRTVDELARAGFPFALRHMSNSAAVFTLPESHLDMVRPGMMLYGMKPAPQVDLQQEPAMTVISRVARIRTVPPGTLVSYGCTYRCDSGTVVATVPMGYSDGYRRALSNRFYVLIRGRRAPVIGRVCMNMFMVDVSAIAAVRPGDEVLVFGKSLQGQITVDEMAEAAGTIPQEIVSRISCRVPRFYVNQD